MEEDATIISISIRFASSIPDLLLPPQIIGAITPVTIKQQIRSKLPEDVGTRRLRLIYAGKILNDYDSLSSIVKIQHEPENAKTTSSISKGKAKASAIPLVWLHCSIGDFLSPADLLLETTASSPSSANSRQTTRSASPATNVSTTPAPQGFDRLLSASFTPAEVSALRAQFMTLLAHTHTPDTMPSAAELRSMEDQWLNEGAMANGGGAGDGLNGLAGEGNGLDDMLWGNLMGFFWPLGAGLWLVREDMVWTTRRKLAIFVGICINILFATMRFAS